jgi:flagellar hook-associated protein 3 FlgL
MNINGFQTVRVSELARTSGAARQIAQTQARLADAERQVSTGKRLNTLSDAPADAAAAQQVRRGLELREGYRTQLDRTSLVLAGAENAVANVTDLIREARTVALGSLGDGATPAERRGSAEVLDAIREQLLAVANTNVGGLAVFGGGNGNATPYVAGAGGVRYTGGDGTTSALVGDRGAELDLLVDPESFLGAPSRRVGDTNDLSPAADGATRLRDLNGARGTGIELGSIRITNAGAEATVDLSDADTLDDVVTRINASGIGVTAAITGGNAIDLSGASITVGDVGQSTAADLGLLQASASATVTGADLDPRLTTHTPLALLNGGGGIDLAGGLEVTTAGVTRTIPTAGLATVGELLNAVNAAGAEVSATISDDGRSLVLRNPVQGSALRVGEAAGTTAADLGWLTFTANDPLSDLNGGRGVRLDAEGADLVITDTADVRFEVELGGAATVADVIAAVNAASASAGSSVTMSFDGTAPGLSLTGVESVATINGSHAVADLGLEAVPVAGVVTGRDVNPVTSEGVFGHLSALSAALRGGDEAGARRAVSDLEADEEASVQVRGEVGGRLREVERRLDTLADDDLAAQEMLSRLEDADLPTAILEYQALQSSLQAQLQTAGRALNLSLFDFLR